MIQIDTFSKIGKSHQVCEDYIFSGDDPVKYIILSDGCSSSKNTEMGARILCHLAKQYLRYRKDDYRFPYLDYDEMGLWIIHNAELTAKHMGLEKTCLDATLIVAFEFKAKVHVYIFGDGTIVTQNQDGMTSVSEIEFTSNAPYYLSYKIDPERMASFHKMGQDLIIKTTITNINENKYAYDFKCRFKFRLEKFPKILIASDGMSSFIKNGEPEQTLNIANEFLNFKSTKGEFLKRRLKRALKVYEKNGLYNYDDLSVGGFLYEEK
jgi:hypothetical protein